MPIYLRKEPTNHRSVTKWGPPPNDPMFQDVVAYDDAECTKERRRWRWGAPDRPDRRFRYVSLPEGDNYIVWLPDLPMT